MEGKITGYFANCAQIIFRFAHAQNSTMLLVLFSALTIFEVQAQDLPLTFQQGKLKRPACSDRRDNDRDGLTDYPKDPGCKNRRDKSEKNSTPGGSDSTREDNGSLKGLIPFPSDNPWNEDISTQEVDSNSENLISSIGNTVSLFPAFGTTYEGVPNGIPYVLVPGTQSKVSVSFDYADESDIGPYPIPSDPPIEGGDNSQGDRHIIMIDRDNWVLYELFYAFRTNGRWSAGSGAIFDLKRNTLRPQGWTSADAAGLPIFPGLVRYDEVVELGEIKHALRFTAQRTRKAYVYPARHFASSITSPNTPPMGMRVRLKANYDISNFPKSIQVVLRALKKYGMFLADNGSDWFISGAPDPRWNDDDLHTLTRVKGRDLEVIKMGNIETD